MSIKEKLLCIGIGQGGGNFCQELETRGYRTLAINTSKEDLDTLILKHKYHISGGEGCSKDRNIGRQLIRMDFINIDKHIDSCGDGVEIIFVIFTASGGTGSSMGPILADILSNNPKYKDKIICMAVILPSVKESIQANSNAYCCFSEIANVKKSGACFVLDNNEFEDKYMINKEFVAYLDEFLHIPASDKSTKGNIDFSEIKKTLSAHNMAVMTAIPAGKNTVARLLDSLQNNSIFVKREKDNVLQYTALSLADEELSAEEVNQELQKAIGTPIDNFTTYNRRGRNFICISGLSYPQTRLNQIADIVSKNKDSIAKSQNTKLELTADMSFLQKSSPLKTDDAALKKEPEETLENIWDKYNL